MNDPIEDGRDERVGEMQHFSAVLVRVLNRYRVVGWHSDGCTTSEPATLAHPQQLHGGYKSYSKMFPACRNKSPVRVFARVPPVEKSHRAPS